MKRIVIAVWALVLISCGTTGQFAWPGGTSREAGIGADDADGLSTVYLQYDLSIEYLDNKKTAFHDAGKVLVRPGERSVTLRLENDIIISEYFTASLNFGDDRIYCLGYEIVGGETTAVFYRAGFDPSTGTLSDKEILGRGPLVRKSDNEPGPVVIP